MRKRGSQGGYATLIVLALLGLVLGLAMANTRTLHHLRKEIDRMERLQTGTGHRSALPSTDASE